MFMCCVCGDIFPEITVLRTHGRVTKTKKYCKNAYWTVTKQFADKPARSQPSHRLVNSQSSKVAETFDLKFSATNCYKCDCIVLFSVRVRTMSAHNDYDEL